ncbi:YbjN domain-containing protein [uncultured Sphingomonas sp.]|uniref:YbjN domain-containing protein n=1 Tax=uncultured Sphingomonas sp. TaxID=158754 RepID=UPI0035CC2CCF
MRIWPNVAVAGVALAAFAGPADAKDTLPCPSGLVCATVPATVTDFIKSIDPKAVVSKDSKGLPKIDLSAAYKYSIYFRDCENNTQCAAITFVSDFTPDPAIDLAFVNKWNRDFRVPKAYLGDDGALNLEFEVSTVGGITQANLRDVKSWFESGLGDFGGFYDKQSTARKAATPAKK